MTMPGMPRAGLGPRQQAQLGPRQQAQWQRLRALGVRRAREALAAAQAECAAAQAQVAQRLQAIDRARAALAALDAATVHDFAPHMPRWAATVGWRRDHLFEQVEREEYALIDDEQALEEAQARERTQREALARALAREQAVDTVVAGLRRAAAQAREQRAERELDARPLRDGVAL